MKNRYVCLWPLNSLNKNHMIGFFRFGVAYRVKRYPIWPCQPFWELAIFNFVVKCYFLWTHYHIITKLSMCLWHNAQKILKKVSRQHHLVVRRYNKNFTTANNFCLLLRFVMTLDRFLGSCREQWYQLCHGHPNFLSAILKYFENIHLRTDFHQNITRSSSVHADKKLWYSNNAQMNRQRACQNGRNAFSP